MAIKQGSPLNYIVSEENEIRMKFLQQTKDRRVSFVCSREGICIKSDKICSKVCLQLYYNLQSGFPIWYVGIFTRQIMYSFKKKIILKLL